MTIEQECKDAEDARRERGHRVSAGQSKGDYLWKKQRGRIDSIVPSRARQKGQSLLASTLEKEK